MVREGLNRHIKRTSDEVSFLNWLKVVTNEAETEVAKLEGSIFEKDISWFDIPVYNIKTS